MEGNEVSHFPIESMAKLAEGVSSASFSPNNMARRARTTFETSLPGRNSRAWTLHLHHRRRAKFALLESQLQIRNRIFLLRKNTKYLVPYASGKKIGRWSSRTRSRARCGGTRTTALRNGTRNILKRDQKLSPPTPLRRNCVRHGRNRHSKIAWHQRLYILEKACRVLPAKKEKPKLGLRASGPLPKLISRTAASPPPISRAPKVKVYRQHRRPLTALSIPIAALARGMARAASTPHQATPNNASNSQKYQANFRPSSSNLQTWPRSRSRAPHRIPGRWHARPESSRFTRELQHWQSFSPAK